MQKVICPFLGLAEDPATTLDFPSSGNCCHHTRPVTRVDPGHQEAYCLSSGHVRCPIYQAAQVERMPGPLAAPAGEQPAARRQKVLLAIPAVLIALSLLLLSGNLASSGLNTFLSSLVSVPGQSGEGPGQNLLFFGQSSDPSKTEYIPFKDTPGEKNEPAVCAPRAGWTTYVVNPTDSLFRLSIIYKVNIEQLQLANCLGDSTVILPGQVIYVPILPTSTATPTATARIIAPAVQSDSDEEEPRQVQPTPVPPTREPDDPVPPTKEPNTPVPPTKEPGTPVPPTDIPPTQTPARPEPSPVDDDPPRPPPDENDDDQEKDKKDDDDQKDKDKDKKDKDDKKDDDKKDKKDKDDKGGNKDKKGKKP